MPNIKSSVFSHQSSEKKGFTLIELLVAITILAIISTIGLATYSSAQIAGRDGKRKQDIRALSTALEVYFQSQNPKAYVVNTGVNSTQAGWLTLFPTPTTNFINIMPIDPVNDPTFNYRYIGDLTTFELCTNLENDEDDDINSVCPAPYDFGVENP